eukprot:c6805_g1_i1.p1 GENE.c6805_g1_i1~~c6805_g1_i1.p1  ORF type:complete len:468 (+),score=119.15 c6805_g1_i1:107-1405(+)
MLALVNRVATVCKRRAVHCSIAQQARHIWSIQRQQSPQQQIACRERKIETISLQTQDSLRTFSLSGKRPPTSDTPFEFIPIIDLAAFLDPHSTPEARREVANEIGVACEQVGFFLIVNHGIKLGLINEMLSHTKSFFASPIEHKSAASMKTAGAIRGYFAIGEENLHEEGYTTAIDIKEGFDVGFDECATDFPKFPPNTMLNNFPPRMNSALVLKYRNELTELGRKMAGAFALSLELDENYFSKMFINPMATLRQLHYPPSIDDATDLLDYMSQHDKTPTHTPTSPSSPSPSSAINPSMHSIPRLGCGAHTDYGCCTLLYQDSTGGLQARNTAGQWVNVPYVEGSFVVNIGDMMQRWTNGRFRSTVHRVKSNPSQHRYSIPFFFNPNAKTVIECLPTCWSESNPKKFDSDTCGNVLMGRYMPTMQHLGKERK